MSYTPLSRGHLQKLALVKADDASLLFAHKRYSNAYYLFGYSVELGLKACVARQIVSETIPDRAVLTGFLKHRFDELVSIAGLSTLLKNERENREFDIRWSTVAEWSVDSRYDMIDVLNADAMRDAIEHPEYGVLAWLKRHW